MSAALNSLEERASPVVLVLGSVSAAPRTYSHSSQHLGRLPFSSLPALVNSVYSVAQPGEDLRKSMSCNSLVVEFLPSTHKVMGSIPNSNKMMGGKVLLLQSCLLPVHCSERTAAATAQPFTGAPVAWVQRQKLLTLLSAQSP